MSVASTTMNPVQNLPPVEISTTYIADRWLQIPREYAEIPLGTDLLLPILDALGISIEQRKQQTAIHRPGKSVLRPDFLVYQDIEKPPVLVIEIKKRISIIYDIPEAEFDVQCKEQYLYRAAIGYEETKENGVRQYLDPETVRPEFLAPYGLVFNGDFFQLWRRVDGLIFPITPIEKFTNISLPRLLYQLQICLQQKPPALIAAVWNRKGGVAKTTNAINIAATLALASPDSPRRVLLIDLDPQGDLAHGIGLDQAADDQLMQQLFDKLALKEAEKAKGLLTDIIRTKKFPTSDRTSFELSLFSMSRKMLEGFRNNSQQNPVQLFLSIINLIRSDYDYVFIDAAPVVDPLVQCVFSSCDVILLPVDGEKSLRHAAAIDRAEIPKIRMKRYKSNTTYGPWSLGIVRSNWAITEGSVVDNLFIEEAAKRGFSKRLYKVCLKQYAQAEVAAFKKAPVVCWQSSPITKLYGELTQEIFLSANFIDQ
jgi:chromosome partitioning protein